MFIFILAILICVTTSIVIMKIDTLPSKWKTIAQATTLILTTVIGFIALIVMVWIMFL